MDPGERVTIIREIAASLSPAEWGEIDLVLREFGFSTQDAWSGTEADYVREMVSRGAEDDLRRLHAFLYSAPEPGAPRRRISSSGSTSFSRAPPGPAADRAGASARPLAGVE